MLQGQHKPLDFAKQVLAPELISSVRQCPEIHLRGWTILDRWAYNSPEKLQDLAKQGEVMLLGRLIEQQTLEHTVLLDSPVNSGTSEREILEMSHVQTELL
ncbi:hypothetical protein [Agrobacterium tumefaciens]|uniref:hypothetical protein n=1 Tax=Agrobacterium tumefaciens TaxID=358 RepID=UPI001572ABD5|nr:hypothetical protein [Agrobacterium tumefaciens]NTB05897.1 hypothetical protein [Agrobacterium tumefaciens]